MNLNDEARVKLTEAGHEHLRKQMLSMGLAADFSDYRIEDGWYKTELWSLMATFGDGLYNGGPNLFEGNEVKVKSRR